MDHAATLPMDSHDGQQCRRAVVSLPITNVPEGWERLSILLEDMVTASPPAVDYLDVLELARAPLAFLQSETSHAYAAKPLPPSEEEALAFERVTWLWRAMAISYARVAQIGAQEPGIKERLALICQRCIYYSGQVIIEHYRARRAVRPGLWLDLHGYYDTAEDWELAEASIFEPLGLHGRTSSCRQAYAAVLLLDLANPYSRTPEELGWITQWAQRFAAHARIVRPDEEAGSRGYGINLMLDQGVRPVETMAGADSARLFDTGDLAPELQKVLAKLKGGASPAELGLGETCHQPIASRLLLQVYRPWCRTAIPRRFERRAAHGSLAMVYGFDAVHYYVGGKEFVQPSHVRMFSRAEMDTLWTFRNQVDPARPLNVRAAQFGYTIENWDIADQSLNGYRLYRTPAGGRVEHRQLLAVKPGNSDFYLLAEVSWLLQEADGRLHAGINVMPGRPEAVCVRAVGLQVSPSAKYTPAFLLPAVPSLREPASVILPRGWFHPERVVELFTDHQVQVILNELLSQGANFERCSFSAA
jgi:hypothetical protein